MKIEDNAPHTERSVKLPDELWDGLLRTVAGARFGMVTTVRLFNAQIISELLLSNRGYLLGRILSGPPQIDGIIDSSSLTFTTSEIEAVEVPAFRFWQRPKWVTLNPQHPTRRAWQNKEGKEVRSAI